MKEVIILEVNGSRKSQLIQDFLKSKKIDYRILAETQLELNDKKENAVCEHRFGKQNAVSTKQKEQLKQRLIAAYKRQAKNKKLQAELSLWDSISGDGLNDK